MAAVAVLLWLLGELNAPDEAARETVDAADSAEGTPAAEPPQVTSSPPAGQPPRIVVALGVSVAGYIYLGETSTRPSASVTPDEKLMVGQGLGVGYVVNSRLTMMLSGIFIETLYSNPMGPRSFTFGGVTPWANVRLGHGFSFGVGPVLWYRGFGVTELSFGAYSSLGYTIPIPSQRLGVTFSLTAPQIYGERFAVALSGGVGVAKRF